MKSTRRICLWKVHVGYVYENIKHMYTSILGWILPNVLWEYVKIPKKDNSARPRTKTLRKYIWVLKI